MKSKSMREVRGPSPSRAFSADTGYSEKVEKCAGNDGKVK